GVLLEVFEDFRYTDELVGAGRPDAPSQALIFDARVMGKSVQGLDLLRFGDDGLVTGLTVMVRPLPAAMTLARAVGRRMEGAEGPGGPTDTAHHEGVEEYGQQGPRTPRQHASRRPRAPRGL